MFSYNFLLCCFQIVLFIKACEVAKEFLRASLKLSHTTLYLLEKMNDNKYLHEQMEALDRTKTILIKLYRQCL